MIIIRASVIKIISSLSSINIVHDGCARLTNALRDCKIKLQTEILISKEGLELLERLLDWTFSRFEECFEFPKAIKKTFQIHR